MSTNDMRDDPELKRQLRKLDGMLPESVDRRQFFKGSVASIMAGMAGCMGGGGGSTPTPRVETVVKERERTVVKETTPELDDRKLVRQLVWRQPWKAEPHYSIAYAAELEGFWADQNISPPRVQLGHGSGDTTKRVATGTEMFGNSNSVPQVSSILENGVNFKQFGIAKQRINRALLYNPEAIPDPTDINGTKIGMTSALGTQTIGLYIEAVGADRDTIETTVGKQAAIVSLMGQGELDAIWSSVDDLGPNNDRLEQHGVQLKAAPLYNYLQVVGYQTIVNADWLNQKNNVEFTSRILTGYSAAGKWCLLNPEKAIQMMIDHVNNALSTWSEEARMSNLRAGMAASNTVELLKTEGFAYLPEDKHATTLEATAKALGGSAPDPAEVRAGSVIDEAEFAKFTSDEWKQLNEFTGDTDRFFEV